MKALGFDDLGLFSRVAALGTLSAVAHERETIAWAYCGLSPVSAR